LEKLSILKIKIPTIGFTFSQEDGLQKGNRSFLKNLKTSLGISKLTTRLKINEYRNIKDPLQVINETNERFHKKVPTQIPLSPQNLPARNAAKLPLENDAVILTLLKNYDWLGKSGIRCFSGNFKLTSTKSLNCKILKKKIANDDTLVSKIQKVFSLNNTNDLINIQKD
jgi:hypothetical protein